MKGVLTIIPVGNAAVTRKELTAAPVLEDLQKGVGGDIELVPHFIRFEGKPCVAFCNEEGKLNGLPLNVEATDIWWLQDPRSVGRDHLVGPIVIITGDRELMKEL